MAEETTTEKKEAATAVDDKGVAQAASIKIGTDAALAFTKFMLRQQAINRMRQQQMRDAAAISKPTLTDKDLATINTLSDAAVREAKAEMGRGGSGFDAERLRAARDKALKKAATFLSKKQEGELKKRESIAKGMRTRMGTIASAQETQRMGVVDDVGKLLANEELAASLGKLGERQRKKEGQETEKDIGVLEEIKKDEDAGTRT
tara:strand:+ start:21167 stop:21781 length:615 start_codon:yes stop_codon:yes gene_type:complete